MNEIVVFSGNATTATAFQRRALIGALDVNFREVVHSVLREITEV
jgi:hypothetical protein